VGLGGKGGARGYRASVWFWHRAKKWRKRIGKKVFTSRKVSKKVEKGSKKGRKVKKDKKDEKRHLKNS